MDNLAEIETAKALVEHAKGKWIGGAERGIAAARMALRDAKNDEERKKAAVVLPKGNTPQLMVMKGFDKGSLLHCARELRNEVSFEYTLDAGRSGNYALAATVVTVHSDQKLRLSVNGAEEAVEIALPYGAGMEVQTEPVEVALVQSRNVLRFTRPAPGEGMTILDFTLRPLR